MYVPMETSEQEMIVPCTFVDVISEVINQVLVPLFVHYISYTHTVNTFSMTSKLKPQIAQKFIFSMPQRTNRKQ